VSACFIQSVEDSMDGIYELLKSEAKLFKFGSGSGTNFSSLRSRFEKLSGGGTSSGLMSFLEIFDKSAGSIKSGGTTRRAAKMVCLDLDHPELLDFINWKRAEEKKAKVLIQNGYQDGFEGEAFRSVSGQNSNNSVRITDQFMKALKSKQSVDLKFRSDGKSWKSLPAQDIWKNIAEAAWECADPGLQFHDTINQWHTCVASGEIRASNPCSEFMFLDDSACNLASINLLKFFDNQGHFLVDDFIHTVRTVFLAQELLVDYAGYPTEKICQNSHDYRPLGMGICGLGAALMSAGVPYDSEQGRNRASEISALMQASCFMQSTVFAKIKGAFAGYSKNKKHVQLVHKMHFEFVKNLSDDLSVKDRIVGQFLVALRNLSKTGIRNSQLTVIAPTGTIGLVMDCETTGIEPEFSLVKFKTLAGGGSLKFISSSLFKGLAARGYQESEIKKIEKHLLEHQGIEGAIKDQDLAVFDCAMKNGVGKRFIKPEAHLLMMAAVQPFISGAISKTVNLPMDTTVDEISDLYFRAWELGLKSVAIYREGSKLSEPLTRGKVGQSLDPFTEIKCVDCGG
jgi:ribonucleoside-diphosphate reductase alpha chain